MTATSEGKHADITGKILHEAQLLNYLKATPIEVGMLLNFGPKAEAIRKVYDNSRKGPLSWTNWPQPDSK